MDHDNQDHQERIKKRAHEIWESEGRPEGRDSDHWNRAEEELRSQMGNDGQTDSDAQPKQKKTSRPDAAKPAAAKKPRKSTKSAKSDGTPYLNDGK